MTDHAVATGTVVDDPTRRRFLSRLTNGLMAAMAAVVGGIVGGATISSRLGRLGNRWLPAATLTDLRDNEPTPVTLRVVRPDGYRDVVDRRTIFLVKTGDAQVLALDSTCTHLGCRVAWDAQQQILLCPCHGGAYDKTCKVISGPPPAPLASISTRLDGDRVMVQV